MICLQPEVNLAFLPGLQRAKENSNWLLNYVHWKMIHLLWSSTPVCVDLTYYGSADTGTPTRPSLPIPSGLAIKVTLIRNAFQHKKNVSLILKASFRQTLLKSTRNSQELDRPILTSPEVEISFDLDGCMSTRW